MTTMQEKLSSALQGMRTNVETSMQSSFEIAKAKKFLIAMMLLYVIAIITAIPCGTFALPEPEPLTNGDEVLRENQFRKVDGKYVKYDYCPPRECPYEATEIDVSRNDGTITNLNPMNDKSCPATGFICSPSYPDGYMANSKIRWIIEPTPATDYNITLEFPTSYLFQLENSESGCLAKILVGSKLSSEDAAALSPDTICDDKNNFQTFCDAQHPADQLIPAGEVLVIEFCTGPQGFDPWVGFNATWTAVRDFDAVPPKAGTGKK